MGLDVYLHRYVDHAAAKAQERFFNEQTEKAHEAVLAGRKFNDLSERERDAYFKKTAAKDALIGRRLGMVKGQYGWDPLGEERIELPSVAHPDHMFKIGYFRSSYNDGGIDRVLRAKIGLSLSDIFGRKDDAYEFQPDWMAARDGAALALARLREAKKDGSYRATCLSPVRLFDGPENKIDSEQAALDMFAQERKRRAADKAPDGWDRYSNGAGDWDWSAKPSVFRAFINGVDIWKKPCVYAVYEVDPETDAWYEQALEVVVETCEWVLAQPQPEQFWLRWSA